MIYGLWFMVYYIYDIWYGVCLACRGEGPARDAAAANSELHGAEPGLRPHGGGAARGAPEPNALHGAQPHDQRRAAGALPKAQRHGGELHGAPK